MTTDEAKNVLQTSLASSAKSAERLSGSTSLSHWNRVSHTTLVNEYNKRAGENIELKKVGRTNKAFDKDGNEIPKDKMIKLIIDQNKTMQAQATTGIQ